MKRKTLLSLLVTLSLCLTACSDAVSVETDDTSINEVTTEVPKLDIKKVKEYKYTSTKIVFPEVEEEIEPLTIRDRTIGFGAQYSLTNDNRMVKVIITDVESPNPYAPERTGIYETPALAVYDPLSKQTEIIYFTRQDSDTMEWVNDISFYVIHRITATPDGGFAAIVRQRIVHKNEYEEILYGLSSDDLNNIRDGIMTDAVAKKLNGVTLEELRDYQKNRNYSDRTITANEIYNFNSWDSEGHLRFSVPIAEIIPDISKIREFVQIENGNTYFRFDSEIIVFSSEGELLYTTEIPEEYTLKYLIPDQDYSRYAGLPKLVCTDDKVYYCIFGEKTKGGQLCTPILIPINDETQSFGEVEITLSNISFAPTLGEGVECYYNSVSELRVITLDGENEKLFSWGSLGVYNPVYYKVVSAEKIIAAATNSTTKEMEFFIITNETETDERQAIRLAYDENGSGVKMSDIVSCIQDFNSTNEDYRIDFVPYSSDATGKSASEKLVNDILTGNAPDLILFGSSITPETFVKIDALADLYPLMEAGGRYTKSDFIPCVLEPFENSKGELPYMTTDYYIATMVGKSSALDGRTSWTFADMQKLNASLESGQAIMSVSADANANVAYELLEELLPHLIDTFIDYENQTCDFTGEFKQLLEFCNTAQVEKIKGYVHPTQYQSEDVLLKSALYMLENFLIDRHVNFRNGDITYIGYPEADGTIIRPVTRFGITKQSKFAEGAWEFIQDYLDRQAEKWESKADTTSYPNTEAFYFPATYDVLDAMLDLTKEFEFMFKINIRDIAGTNQEQVTYGIGTSRTPDPDNKFAVEEYEKKKLQYDMSFTVTDDDVSALYELLEGIQTAYIADADAEAIILEEASTYFSGAKSLDEVIKLIQNRVSRLVSE